MQHEGDRPLERVTEGVFFTTPSGLPRGRHELPREAVIAAQSERAMIAATELLAAHGYRGVGVREISARAAISRGAFYECFDDKDACVFAAYDRFVAVLLSRLHARLESGRPPEMSWPDYVAWVLTGYLEGLQSDLVVARAFLVELDALGRPARIRRRQAIQGFATMLHARREETAPEENVPVAAYASALAAVRQLASDAVDGLDVAEGAAATEPDVVGLVPEMRGWLDQMLARPSGTLR